MASIKNPLAEGAEVDRNGSLGEVSATISNGAANLSGDKKPEHPPFATCCNMISIGVTFFSFSLALSLASIALFVYVPQGMSLIWVTQVGIITFCLGNPLVLYFASLSDNLTGKWARWGRRKPFVVAAIVPTIFSAIMLAYPNNSNKASFEYSFLVAAIVLTFSPALFIIPFKSWMIESCSSPEEYTSINGVITITALLGGLMGQVVLSTKNVENPFAGARLCTLITLFLLPTSVAALCYFVPSRELQKAPEQPPIISSFRQCIRTKEFQTIFWNETLTQMAGQGTGQLTYPILYFFFGMKRVGSIQMYFGPALYTILLGSIVSILSLTYFLKRFEKLVVYRAVMLLIVFVGICTVGTLFPGCFAYKTDPPLYTEKQQAVQIVIFLGLFVIATCLGVCMGFVQSLLVRDLITFDTFTTGLNRESMYQTAISVPASLLATVPTNIVMGILNSSGYKNKEGPTSADPYIDEVYGWNDGTLVQITLYVLLFSCGIGFGAYYLMKDYGLTTVVSKRMEEINLAKDNRKKALAIAVAHESGVHSVEDGSNKSSSLESVGSALVLTLTDESNLMNHFSQLENKAMKEASVVDGHNEAMTRIRNSILLGGAVLGPLAMISLLVGTIYQIRNGLPFATLCLTFFSILMMYVGYEIFRYLAMQKLYAMSNDEIMGLVRRAVERNSKYKMNLKEALDKAEIDESEEDHTKLEDDHPLARLTMTTKATKKSLLEEAEPEDEKHPLSGYKRIFSSCCFLIVVGILAAIQKP